VEKVRELAEEFDDEVIVVCAKIESEIAELEGEEKKMFLECLKKLVDNHNDLSRAPMRLIPLK